MYKLAFTALLVVLPAAGHAQTTTSPPASAAVSQPKFSTSETDIGTILDDPAAKAILERSIPGMTKSDQIDSARGMTLKAIQPYAADTITDAKLAEIDAAFAKLPSRR